MDPKNRKFGLPTNLISAFLQFYNSIYFRLLLIAAVISISVAIIIIDIIPFPGSMVYAGKPSPRTIKADRTVKVKNYDRTDALKKAAADEVRPVYIRNASAFKIAEEKLIGNFTDMETIIDDGSLNRAAKRDRLRESFKEKLTENELTEISGYSADELKTVETKSRQLLFDAMKEPITADNLDIAGKRIESQATGLSVYGDSIAKKITIDNVAANLSIDKKATEKSIDRAVAAVKPVVSVRQRGEVIISEGKVVTVNQLKTLEDMGLLNPITVSDFRGLLGLMLSVSALVAISALYIKEFQVKIYRSNLRLFLLSIILLMILAVAKGLVPVAPSAVIPVAAAAMIVTILLNYETGIVMAIISGLMISLISGTDSQFVFVATGSGLAGVYLTAHISYRSDMTRAGLWLMLVMGILAISISLLNGDIPFDAAVNLGWGVIGGFFAIMLTIAGTQFLEFAFNLTTDMRLLELANPSQSLLKELLIHAPGTYNHSIVTGNLAERAAEMVGANPLLTRVGAYYHDIGKVRRPFFFVENQFGDNPHDKTKPNLSCLIITSHVKEGVELAKQYRLPKEIVKIINQHHGTSLLSYFYDRAKQTPGKEEISDVDYRYPGEKPRSREAALVMLADSAEAAVRTIAKPTPKGIEQMIKNIIQSKLEDGQLDQCDLTLGDIEIIAQIYTRTLTTMYHSRIDYPACELPRQKRGITAGSFTKQPVGRPHRVAGS